MVHGFPVNMVNFQLVPIGILSNNPALAQLACKVNLRNHRGTYNRAALKYSFGIRVRGKNECCHGQRPSRVLFLHIYIVPLPSNVSMNVARCIVHLNHVYWEKCPAKPSMTDTINETDLLYLHHPKFLQLSLFLYKRLRDFHVWTAPFLGARCTQPFWWEMDDE